MTFATLRTKFGRPSSALFQHGLLSGVVDQQLVSTLQHYFGQQIGFYFAFMQHLFSYGFALSVLLAPLLAVYSVDWAQHLVSAMNRENFHLRAPWHMSPTQLEPERSGRSSSWSRW